ncbi:hypothetical protein [Streptomyces sp. NPDC056669]
MAVPTCRAASTSSDVGESAPITGDKVSGDAWRACTSSRNDCWNCR